MTLASEVIAEARKHVGYVEGPKKNNMFGQWYGANGQPWCAMFVSYCIYAAGGKHLVRGIQTSKGFSSCGAGIKWFKARKQWFDTKQAKPGDLVFFDWDGDGIQDHVGIVVSNNPKKKTMQTIEGNTNDANRSNGGACQAKTRQYANIIGVGRPAYDPGPKPATAEQIETAATAGAFNLDLLKGNDVQTQ